MKLADVFDDIDAQDTRSVLDQATAEWGAQHWTGPDKIVQGWRDARNMYELALPPDGWFVDIEHADSLAAINKSLASLAAAYGLTRFTRAHLCGEDRSLTTEVAAWVRSRTLYDGSLPHGIAYSSKHGQGVDWDCHAVWLRALDTGQPPEAELTTLVDAHAIAPPEQDIVLARVSKTLGLTIL